MRNWVIAMTLATLPFPSAAVAQSKDDLLGTWKLVSATHTTDKGDVKDAFGPNPIGFITYTTDGRMMAIITYSGRKPLSVPDHVAAPADERAEAFASMIAYAGRYSLAGDKVIHHVEASWRQDQVGSDLVRFAKVQGDRLTLRTPPMIVGGVRVVSELVWERMK
jgi:hypothetical protein